MKPGGLAAGLSEGHEQALSVEDLRYVRTLLWMAEDVGPQDDLQAATLDQAIADAVESSRFAGDVIAGLRRGPTPAAWREPADPGTREWARRTFQLRAWEADLPPTRASLFALCLEQPQVEAVIDRLFPHGSAAGLAALASASVPAKGRPGPCSTDAGDLTNCYRLILGREPESEAVVEPRPDAPPAEAAMAFLLSPEFREQVLDPALDDRLAARSFPDDALRLWAERTFDIVPPEDVNAFGLLACILRQPWVSARIGDLSPYWPGGPLAARLERAGRASAAALVGRMASGVTVLDVSGVERPGRGRRVTCASGDASFVFALEGEAAKGELALLELGAAMNDRRAAGRLQLDYGGGFHASAELGLRPGRDGLAEAVVAGAARLKRLRWFPTERRSAGELTRLSARPLTITDALDRVQDQGGSAAMLLGETLRAAAAEPEARLAHSLSRVLSPPPLNDYEIWLQTNEPEEAEALKLWRTQLAGLQGRPLFSIVTPTYNTPARLLHEMVESVRAQVYPHWELCIADDASTEPHLRPMLEAYAREDGRIRLALREANGHIARASNSALELATGEWTVLLDHDDLLRPNALLALALEVERHPDAQILYSDEDKLEGPARTSPYFKPDYSPELFLAQNYFNHLTAHRTGNIRAVGGWRPGFEGSQDYDLSLRILERVEPSQVRHIPEVLYHWRAVQGSTAAGIKEKGYALEAGRRALQEHLDRTRPGATAEVLDVLPLYRVRPPLREPRPRLSLIIPTRDGADILAVAVNSIRERSTYTNYDIIILDNGSTERATSELFAEFSRDERIRILPYPGSFNYSAINNYAARICQGDILGLVNNDIEVLAPDWMEEMASWAMQDGVGCVGAKLLYPDMTVQHAGVVTGLGGVAGHSHKHIDRFDVGYFGRAALHSNFSAVTAACLFVRREVFEEVGGLDEGLAVAFNDVDFCLRVREAGYRNVYTPYAELIHHESKSRGSENTPAKIARFNREIAFIKARWGDGLMRDPYYSPNLTFDREDFSIGCSVWARSKGMAS